MAESLTFVRAGQASGAPLVLCHGWSFNHGVWAALGAQLEDEFALYLVDLPGHGGSPLGPSPHGVLPWGERVAEVAPAGAWLVGWSLGGLVALGAALARPDAFAGVALIASTPRFVAGADWRHGVEPAVFDGFAGHLGADTRATLRRFLAMQGLARGEQGALARTRLRRLEEHVVSHGLATVNGLHAGLAVLRQSDLRAQLDQRPVPVHALFAGRDPLVRASVATTRYFDSVAIVAEAGHALPVSHPRAVAHWLRGCVAQGVRHPCRTPVHPGDPPLHE